MLHLVIYSCDKGHNFYWNNTYALMKIFELEIEKQKQNKTLNKVAMHLEV